MIPMIFFILFSFFLTYLIFGIYVFLKNSRSLANRMLFSICLNLSIWAFGYAFMTIAPNQEIANSWRIVASIGWCLIYSTWLDFAIQVKGENKKWMADSRRLLIYLPSLFFFIGNLRYKPSAVIERYIFIWRDKYPNSIFEILYIIYYFVFAAAGIIMIYKWGKKSILNREKKQANIIVITSLISFALAMFTDTILPLFGIFIFAPGIIMFSIALLGLYYAITQYKMMSLSSQDANEYILKIMNDPVMLIGNDLLIKEVNNAALSLAGYEGSELIGLPINNFILETETSQSAIEKLLVTGAVKNIEVGLRTKSNTSIHCLFSGSLIHNELNDVLGIACVFNDITDRINAENILLNAHHELEKKVHERTNELEEINTLLEEEIHVRLQAEEGLISSEEKFRALIKQSSDGIIVIDQETWKLVECNKVAHQILGLTEKEIVELIIKNLNNTYHDEIIVAIINILEKKTQQTQQILKYSHSNGTIRDLKIAVTLVGYSNKQYIMITIRDLTEEIIMEERKQQMAKMDSLGTLSGGIAHDFNNILAGIMGYTQLTIEELEDGIIGPDNLLEVLKLGDRAKKLISQILTFSKKTLISPESVDLSILIVDVLKMLKATLPADINIDFKKQGDSFYVFADQGEMHQLITNLCVNAELSMRKKGGTLQLILSKVTIEEGFANNYQMLKGGKYIKLEVIDSGCGMEETVQKRIFEPFFTTRGSHGGTGLGLSVVHGIVSRFEGIIKVESELDRGSTFTVLLPDINKYESNELILEKINDKGSARILFVDDEEAIVKVVQKLLQRIGYIVTGVLDAREALEIFKKNMDAFDIVLTDQSMPDMSGDMLIKQLRSIRPEIPIVVSSGYIHEQISDENNIEYLIKPVAINDYVKAIDNLLLNQKFTKF